MLREVNIPRNYFLEIFKYVCTYSKYISIFPVNERIHAPYTVFAFSEFLKNQMSRTNLFTSLTDSIFENRFRKLYRVRMFERFCLVPGPLRPHLWCVVQFDALLFVTNIQCVS
jgi:hypothetical protein